MRLIDADELLNQYPEGEQGEFPFIPLYEVRNNIKRAPTIDTVKHAHWIFYKDMGSKYIECSNCGAESGYDDEINQLWGDYCKYCGAKMDEVIG